MTRIAILIAGTAALALAACGGADDAADDTTVIETETIAPTPAATVTEPTAGIEDDTGDDSVTLTRDAVEADISDGDTRVTVDTADNDPAVRVQD